MSSLIRLLLRGQIYYTLPPPPITIPLPFFQIPFSKLRPSLLLLEPKHFTSKCNGFVSLSKCPYDQIFDFHFFTFSCTIRPSYSSCQISSITNIRSHFILTFISENLRPPLINLVPRLGCKLEKVTSKTQTYLTG